MSIVLCQQLLNRVMGLNLFFNNNVFQPQLGIPDVFIWMITGTKRVAYHRIPINELMYSRSKFKRGKHCGTTGSFFLKVLFKLSFNHSTASVINLGYEVNTYY